MNWQNYITADPFICEGRACFKDTQLMVSSVLENLANGFMPNEIRKKYPSLNQDAIQAALAFAADVTREQSFDESRQGAHREVIVAGRLEAIISNKHKKFFSQINLTFFNWTKVFHE